MPVDVDVTIQGIQDAQKKNLEVIHALRPRDRLGRAIKDGATLAHRYAVAMSHVDTGALRASHRIRHLGDHAVIFIDPAATNPDTGQKVQEYGRIEHERGGSHAFYDRVVDERGREITDRIIRTLAESIR